MKGGVFLVDILINAAGALMMVFLVFVSRQYTASAAIPPSTPRAGVLHISVTVDPKVLESTSAGDALKDTLLKLCTSQCVGPYHTGQKDKVLFPLSPAGENNEVQLFSSVASLGVPSVDRTGLNEGKLSILIPCPVAGMKWSLSLDYGTVWGTTSVRPREVSIVPELLGSDPEARVEPADGCMVTMSADMNAVCEWELIGNSQCGDTE